MLIGVLACKLYVSPGICCWTFPWRFPYARPTTTQTTTQTTTTTNSPDNLWPPDHVKERVAVGVAAGGAGPCPNGLAAGRWPLCVSIGSFPEFRPEKGSAVPHNVEYMRPHCVPDARIKSAPNETILIHIIACLITRPKFRTQGRPYCIQCGFRRAGRQSSPYGLLILHPSGYHSPGPLQKW